MNGEWVHVLVQMPSAGLMPEICIWDVIFVRHSSLAFLAK